MQVGPMAVTLRGGVDPSYKEALLEALHVTHPPIKDRLARIQEFAASPTAQELLPPGLPLGGGVLEEVGRQLGSQAVQEAVREWVADYRRVEAQREMAARAPG